MVIAKDYDDASRTTAVPTFEEQVRSAMESPEVWQRQFDQRASNIEHARGQRGFDQVMLARMVEHQIRAKQAMDEARRRLALQ